MSEGSPSQRFPRSLNPRKFAYAGVTLQGYIDSSDMARLAEAVDAIGDTKANIGFLINEEGKMVVEGNVRASLAYQCQRCMETMEAVEVEIDFTVAIVRNEDEAKSLPKSLDPWVVEEDEASVVELIEDELLLSLPVVSYHDHACVDASMMQAGGDDTGNTEKAETEKTNPFSVLAKLKDD